MVSVARAVRAGRRLARGEYAGPLEALALALALCARERGALSPGDLPELDRFEAALAGCRAELATLVEEYGEDESAAAAGLSFRWCLDPRGHVRLVGRCAASGDWSGLAF